MIPGRDFTPSADYYRAQAEQKSPKPGMSESPVKASPGFRSFIERQRQAAMFANNTYQYEPVRTGAWSRLTEEQQKATTPLPAHTYTMSAPETVRIRQELADAAGTPTSGYTQDVPPTVLPNPAVQRELSWEEFDKLSDEDKAIARFNTDFLEARNLDLKNQKKYGEMKLSEEVQTKYDETVNNIFGAQGGSMTYAPNTVALLESVGLKAKGQDLDEYLSLERVISDDELRGLDLEMKPEVKQYTDDMLLTTNVDREVFEAIRSDENLKALDVDLTQKYAKQIEKVMADGTLRLASVRESMQSSRSALITELGGAAFTVTPTTGFPTIPVPGSAEATTLPDQFGTLSADEQLGQMFRATYEVSLNKGLESNGIIWDWIEENKLTKDEQDRMWNYVNARLEQDEEFGTPELVVNSPNVGGDARTPDEARVFLGMDRS